MKTLNLLALTCCTALVASAATNDTATAAAAAEAQPSPQQLREANVDEIDLEELEDSAEAAKRPKVTSDDAKSGPVSFVDIDCDDATLADILRQFRKTTGANIISGESTNLARRVSVTLRHVPWRDALQAMLNTRGFRLEERGDILFVSEDRQADPKLTKAFSLNHASCEELAKLFNANYAPKGTTIANAFAGANTVVVTSNEKTLNDCEAIIRAVDRAVAQIYIEARFLELSNEAKHQLGLQWDSLEKIGASTKNVGITATKTETDGDETRTATFTGTLSASNFGLYLSAFEKLGGTQIFSNPKVIVSNGKEAVVDMTTKYPNLRITSKRDTSTTTPYTDYTAELEEIKGDKENPDALFAGSSFYSWGISLSVKPRISNDGIISVEITPTISQLDTDVTSDGFYQVRGGSSVDDSGEAAYGKYPIISMKRISTIFSMKDGSTAVIGGLSRTVEEDVDSGIPFLRELPWIGQYLFGWKSRQKVQKEIIICVTLGIANPNELPKDMGLPKNAILGREYVNGTKFEPGNRPGTSAEALKLDKRPLEEQVDGPRPGTVVITPSAE